MSFDALRLGKGRENEGQSERLRLYTSASVCLCSGPGLLEPVTPLAAQDHANVGVDPRPQRPGFLEVSRKSPKVPLRDTWKEGAR